MKILNTLLGLMLFFLLVPHSARADTAADVALLRPYMDSQTVAVGHLDTAKIDFAAIDQWLKDVLASGKTPDRELLAAEVRASVGQGKGLLEQFTKLGGRHVYWVVSHTELWPNMKPGAIVIPMEAGGDAKGMVDFLRGLIPAKGIAVAALGKDLIFVGDEGTLKRMQGMKAESRPDLEGALAATPAGALQMVVTPTADERRALVELMPRLPEEVGGGSMDLLASGVKSVTLTVDLPPGLAMALRVDGESGEVSRRVGDLLSRGIAAVSGMLPPGDDPLVPAVAKFLGELKPQVDGSAVVVKLTADQVKEFYPVMEEAIMRSRAVAERQRDAAKLRGIAQACIVLAQENKQAMTDHLGQLLLNNQIAPSDLVMASSRTRPLELTPELLKLGKTDFAAFAKQVDAHCDVVYLGKGTTDTTDAALVLAYEKPGPYSNGEITMVFMDAHAEAVHLDSVADVLRATNEYRKKINLPAVDAEAILKAAKDQGK